MTVVLWVFLFGPCVISSFQLDIFPILSFGYSFGYNVFFEGEECTMGLTAIK